MLKDLVAKFPARGEAAALLARGATDEEKARLNEAAAPVWEELDARLAGLGTSEDRIAAIVEAMPGLALSDYEAKAQGRYSEERTAQLRPVWDDLRGQADAMEDLSARVAFFQEHRGQFEGTGIVKELDAAVVKANNSRLSGMYKQVLAQAKGLGGQEKVDYLAGQIANFSNSMYEQNIRTMLASEKSVLARSAYTQLMKDVRAAEQYGLKKNLIDNALADPMFQDTNFMAQIEKLRDTTKASEAKLSFVALRRIVGRELDAGRKVALLEAALADELIAGSAHEGAVQTMLQKAMQDKKESDAKVALGEVKAQLNQKPQTAEEYDENIARLTAIAQTVAGTKAMAEYDKIVDGQRKGKAALPEVGGEE